MPLFYVFVAADMVFIVLHGLHATELLYVGNILLSDGRFAIDRERGYGEVFEYIKLYWTAVGAGWLWWRTRQAVYGVGVVLFLFLVLDNVGDWHVKVGDLMIAVVDFGWGAAVFGSDMGQIVYWMGIGGAFLVVGGAAYRLANPTHRRRVQQVVWGMGGLAFFGIIIDAIHNAVVLATDVVWADEVLTVVEDGGELVVISWICAVVLAAMLDEAGTDNDESADL